MAGTSRTFRDANGDTQNRSVSVVGSRDLARWIQVDINDDVVDYYKGWAFDIVTVPTVSTSAYTAGDIVGGLLTFSNAARVNNEPVLITGVQIISKSAVQPSYTLILFSADPSATTKTDNAAYSLNAADALKPFATIALGTAWFSHGTPKSVRVDGLSIIGTPVSATRDIYGLLIDGTGVTLASTSDIQIRLRGIGA